MKTVQEFLIKKQRGEKISIVTCYDFTSAMILEKSNVDCVLVGDSGVNDHAWLPQHDWRHHGNDAFLDTFRCSRN